VKKFLRDPQVQSILAWLLAGYLRFATGTIRWRYENRAAVDPLAERPIGVIGCFWHGRIGLAPSCRRVMKEKPRRVLISQSPDGEFIAKVAKLIGIPAIRGSSGRGDPDRLLRSFGASRDVVKFMSAGGLAIITPDGPVGPAETMQMGAVTLARISKKPVVFVGLAARPCFTLKSWDRTRIPLPFGRGSVVFDGPVSLGARPGAAELEDVRTEWQARMRAAQARADALVA
jgi:lysophospholipid acyltransferase (LPLAT)-like uncharacterized protein